MIGDPTWGLVRGARRVRGGFEAKVGARQARWIRWFRQARWIRWPGRPGGSGGSGRPGGSSGRAGQADQGRDWDRETRVDSRLGARQADLTVASRVARGKAGCIVAGADYDSEVTETAFKTFRPEHRALGSRTVNKLDPKW